MSNLFPDWQEAQPPDSFPFSGYLAYHAEMRRLGQYPGTKLERGAFAKRNLEGVKDFRHGRGFGLQGTKVREHTTVRIERRDAKSAVVQTQKGKIRSEQEYGKTQASVYHPPASDRPAEAGPAGGDDLPPW